MCQVRDAIIARDRSFEVTKHRAPLVAIFFILVVFGIASQVRDLVELGYRSMSGRLTLGRGRAQLFG